MQDYPPYDLNIVYRSSHSVLWELADKCGILGQMRLSLQSLEFGDNPGKAEAALFRGDIDFVSGNHVTPYVWVARGTPIVCIASANNGIVDKLVTREPVASLAELNTKSLRVADTNLISSDDGAVSHTRGNHILDISFAGYGPDETEWLELGESRDSTFQANMIDALKSGKADVAFAPRRYGYLEREGFHIMDLPTLPMITGTTITTTYEALNKKEGLGERLIQAMVLTVHYARMHPEEAQRLLDTKMGRPYAERGGRASGVASFAMKPYPTTDGIANVFDLCCMWHEEAKAINPVALWDMRYLRALDMSGFIDELIQEEPEHVRQLDGHARSAGDD